MNSSSIEYFLNASISRIKLITNLTNIETNYIFTVDNVDTLLYDDHVNVHYTKHKIHPSFLSFSFLQAQYPNWLINCNRATWL